MRCLEQAPEKWNESVGGLVLHEALVHWNLWCLIDCWVRAGAVLGIYKIGLIDWRWSSGGSCEPAVMAACPGHHLHLQQQPLPTGKNFPSAAPNSAADLLSPVIKWENSSKNSFQLLKTILLAVCIFRRGARALQAGESCSHFPSSIKLNGLVFSSQ